MKRYINNNYMVRFEELLEEVKSIRAEIKRLNRWLIDDYPYLMSNCETPQERWSLLHEADMYRDEIKRLEKKLKK